MEPGGEPVSPRGEPVSPHGEPVSPPGEPGSRAEFWGGAGRFGVEPGSPGGARLHPKMPGSPWGAGQNFWLSGASAPAQQAARAFARAASKGASKGLRRASMSAAILSGLLLSAGYLQIPPRATARGLTPAASRVRPLRVYPQLRSRASNGKPPPPAPPRAKPTGFDADEGGGGSGKQIGDALMTIVTVLWKTIPGGVASKIVLSAVAGLFTWASSIYLTGVRVDNRIILVNKTLGSKIDSLNETLGAVNKTVSMVNAKINDVPNKTEFLVLNSLFGCFLLCVPWLTRQLPFTVDFKWTSRLQVVKKSDTAHSPVAQPDSPAPPVP